MSLSFRQLTPLRTVLAALTIAGCARTPSDAFPLWVVNSSCLSATEHGAVRVDSTVADCRTTWSELGAAGDAFLYQGSYSRPGEGTSGWRHVTQIIFGPTTDPEWLTALHIVEQEEENAFLQPFTLHEVEGRSIIELTTCLNGTGGCGQEFFEHHGGAIRGLNGDMRQQVQAQLPAGLEQYKSPMVDLDQLRGSGGAWAAGDANCCPSHEVTFDVQLVGDTLRVANVVVGPADST